MEYVHIFLLFVYLFFFFLDMIFLTLGHAANTGAGQTRTPLETAGFARTLRSWRTDRGCVRHWLLWRKGPNMLQQGAVRSCKRRRHLCLEVFETFPLLMSQRLFKSCSSSRVSGSCPVEWGQQPLWEGFSHSFCRRDLSNSSKLSPHQPAVRAELLSMPWTTVWISSFEGFSPVQD